FLIAALRNKGFVDGDIDTGFIERHKAELVPLAGEVPDDALLMAALFTLSERRARARSHSPWDVIDGWRIGAPQQEALRFDVGDSERAVGIGYRKHGFSLSIGARSLDGDVVREADGSLTAKLDGRRLHGRVLRIGGDLAV